MNSLMSNEVILGSRRFRALSPTLVRIEFAPDGVFEDRRSMVAYEQQHPVAFDTVTRDGGWDVLDTGFMQIRTTANDRAFDRTNLEIRWSDGKLMQIWRPGDRDYQNLGGTLRSLDRYVGESCQLDGVHPATMESPDVSAANWPAWLQCEVDPLYKGLHPNAPEHFGRGHWAREVQVERNDGRYTERTWNWYKDARKFCPGVLSPAGYYLLNDSDSAALDADDFPVERNRPGCQDLYFFAYGKDYKQALRDFRLLSGPAPVLPHKSFGIIFSRWPAFTEAEVESMAKEFRANGYPLATLVMDMEWHTEGWGTWDFNPDLIPDPERFFTLCRKYDLEVTFNDHPLDVHNEDSHYEAYVAAAGPDVEIRERDYNDKRLKMAKVDICNKQQNQAFRDVCHTHIMELGLDFWWNDGSRGQMSGTNGQLVCNKTFFEESEREDRRGMLLARYGGLGSHRYGGFFTGDDNSDWHVLKLQVEFNIRAAGVGVGHISHDIGGFMIGASLLQDSATGAKITPPAIYLRWLQFGVFNSILRFHCAPGSGSRLPYDYDSEVGGACRKWLRIRHSLLPYIYTTAREYYETGLAPTRGLFIENPENSESYRFDEFYFGNDLLVVPVFSDAMERVLYLPDGLWWEFETANRVEGGAELTRDVPLDELPVYVKAGSIIPRQDPDGDVHAAHIEHLHLDVYPGADGTADLYEDDGRSTEYKRSAFCRTRFTLTDDGDTISIRGTVIEGKPLGEARSITVTIPLEASPSRALCGKTELPLDMDSDGRYRMAVPEVGAEEEWTLRIYR